MKKLIMVLLSAIIVMAVAVTSPMETLATNDYGSYSSEIDGIRYYYEDGRAYIVSCNTEAEEIVIPEYADGNPVVEINRDAFSDCDTLKKITLPKTLVRIGQEAFWGCEGISSVIIPDSVEEIGEYAFAGCTNLKRVKFPENLKHIRECAFYRCTRLESVRISEGLSSIATRAFEKCESLTEVILPESLTYTGSYAFNDCNMIETLYIGGTIESNAIHGGGYMSSDALKKLVIREGTTEIEQGTFANRKSLDDITLPKTLVSAYDAFSGCTAIKSIGPVGGDYNIKYSWDSVIPENALGGNDNIETLVIPEYITKISSGAFTDRKIENVIMYSNPEGIEDNAFTECTRIHYAGKEEWNNWDRVTENANEHFAASAVLIFGFTDEGAQLEKVIGGAKAQIDVPETIDGKTVYAVCDEAFSGSEGPAIVTLPGTIKSIGRAAFENCAYLQSINIPYGIKKIEDNTFKGCTELRKIFLPSTVSEIGKSAFEGCEKAESIEVPSSVKNIGEYAFSGCTSLGSINTGGITKIMPYTFAGCETFDNVYISENITEIGEGAFENCTGMYRINFEKELSHVGENAFSGCDSIYEIYYSGSEAEWGGIAFDEGNECVEAQETVFMPAIEYDVDFSDGIIWMYFGQKPDLIIPGEIYGETVAGIENCAFFDNTYLRKVTLPQTVESIYPGAFWMSNIREINIPEKVTCIDSEAFSDCHMLEKVTFDGNNVTEIRDSAFGNCDELTVIEIPEKTETIGYGAFVGCTKLEKVIFKGNNLKSIDMGAFRSCVALKSLRLPDGLKTIGSYVFNYCSNLEYVVIPESVTQINTDAFANVSDKFVIKGKPGSYAETFAKTNNIPFKIMTEYDIEIKLSSEQVSLTQAKIVAEFAGETEGISAVKWAYGEKDEDYFTQNGTAFDITAPAISVNKNGMYTFCVITKDGASLIQTVNVSDVAIEQPYFSDVLQNENELIVPVNFDMLSDDIVIYIALYDGDKLEDVRKTVCSTRYYMGMKKYSDIYDVELVKDSHTLKAFVWNEAMQALTEQTVAE